MEFASEQVKSLLESSSIYELRNAESVISDRFEKSSMVTQRMLYEYLTVTKIV